MSLIKERVVYEETMDRISELLEDMILEVILCSLQRIWDRNNMCDKDGKPVRSDDIKF